MNFLTDPLIKVVQTFRKAKAGPAISNLRDHSHPKMKAIGEALHQAFANDVTNEEKDFIDRIEKRRKELRNSTEEIAVIDYGAGSRNSNRSEEEMKAGVPSTALVSNVCNASKPAEWALILFKLVRHLKPSSAVELGSCVGISASYQAGAMKMNGNGNLRTLEGSPEIAKIATQTLSNLNLENATVVAGPFHQTLQNVLESARPIDYFFNDGHHDYHAVKSTFHQSLPFLADEAVVILDDISWSEGMQKAWKEVREDEHVVASVDLDKIGIVILGKSPVENPHFRIPL